MNTTEFYTKRAAYIEHMWEENLRISILFDEHGIIETGRIDYGFCSRYIAIENICSNGCTITHTYFAVPENINLTKLVKWILNHTDFSEVTVYKRDRTPATMRKHDSESEFKHYVGD